MTAGAAGGGALRRGRATEAVFARATRATSTFHVFDPALGALEETTEISVDQARRMFEEDRRVKMKSRADGTHMFIISTHRSYERIVLA